ncbi:MAG: DHHA1 domain-containing protein, partial [bacterium]
MLLTGFKENVYIGSARSCGNIDIYAFLKNYESFFSKFGGHKMACGLTVQKGEEIDD